MFSADTVVLEFIQGNWFTMLLVLGILKLIAAETATTLDNKIFTLVESWLGKEQPQPKPVARKAKPKVAEGK